MRRLIAALRRYRLALLRHELRIGAARYREWRRNTRRQIDEIEAGLCNPNPAE